MTVRYSAHQGHPVPVYACQRRGIQCAQPPCQMIPGAGVDAAVSAAILEAVSPAALDVASNANYSEAHVHARNND